MGMTSQHFHTIPTFWACIFKLLTPLASFSYATQSSTTFLPSYSEPWISGNFYYITFVAMHTTSGDFTRGLAPSPQTCSARLPGTMLGGYKISLMSSYLELGHTRATWKAQWRGRRVYIVSSSDQLSRIRSSTDSDCTRTHLRGPRI